MDPNDKLAQCYDLLGLSPDQGLKAAHDVYLKQLEIWNPNAIDEEANGMLYAEVKRKRQAIDEAHRYIVEQLEAGGQPPGAIADRAPQASRWDATQTPEAAPNAPPNAPLQPGARPGPRGTFVQSESRLLPPESAAGRDRLGPERTGAFRPVIVASGEAVGPGQANGAPSHDGGMDASLGGVAAVVQLLRWDKPAGRAILMIPALWAAFLASDGMPPWSILLIIVVGSIATSAAGCAVNDLWDQDFDAQVERTQNRPLASGRMGRRQAQVVLAICCAISIFLALQLNWTSIKLCIAAGIVILLYPAAKRVFPLPQLVLAIAWGFAVLIGWTAVAQELSFPALLLWLATVLWTLGFDTVYAMADQEDDRRIGLHSSALFFGDRTGDAVGLFFLGTAALMLWLGITQALSWPYWLALIIACLGWVKQHSRLSRHRHRSTTRLYSDIFTQNVWLGLVLLAGMILGRSLL